VATGRRWGKRRRRKSSATAVLVLREKGKIVVGRCGESQGSHRPFVGAGGAPERGGQGSNNSVNGFNTIEDGGEVKRGIKGGNDVRASNGSGGAGWPEAMRRSGNAHLAWGRGWS
jgi:hypothetical protein